MFDGYYDSSNPLYILCWITAWSNSTYE